MGAYLLIYFLSIVSVFFDQKNQKLILFVFVFFMAVVGGLRFEVGYDWLAYEIFFNQIDLNEGLSAYLFSGTFEPFYVFLNYSIKYLGGSIQTVFFVAASFSSYAFYRLIRYLDVDIFLPCVLYVGFCFLLSYFIVVRYSIAVSFFYIGIIYLLKCQYKKFLLSIIIGSLFHVFVLLFLPLIFISKIKSKKMIVILGFFFIGFGFFVDINSIFYFFISLSNDGFFSKLKFYYSPDDRDIPVTVIFYFLFNMVIVFFIWMHSEKNFAKQRILNLSLILTLMVNVAIVMIPQIPSFWNRLMVAAIPLQGVGIYLVILECSKNSKLLVKFFISLIAFCLLVFNLKREDNFFVPYYSYFHHVLGFSTGDGRVKMMREYGI